jgi:hypothetical protein
MGRKKMTNIELMKQIANLTGKRVVATYPYYPNTQYIHMYIETDTELDSQLWNQVQDLAWEHDNIWVMQVDRVLLNFNHDLDADYAKLQSRPFTIGDSND